MRLPLALIPVTAGLLQTASGVQDEPTVATATEATTSTGLLPPSTRTAQPASLPSSLPSPQAAATKTVFWSTVETSVSSPLWIGPTVVTMIADKSRTTLIPEAADGARGGSAGMKETILAHTTYQYRMVFSDGRRSTSWSSNARTYTVEMD